MDTREIAAEYRLAHWVNVMRECQESGLSIRAFCKSAGIHENVYYYWQRKLREAACQKYLPAKQEMTEPETDIVPNGWAICEPRKASPKTSAVHIVIGKCQITATADVDTELLAKVCQALTSIC